MLTGRAVAKLTLGGKYWPLTCTLLPAVTSGWEVAIIGGAKEGTVGIVGKAAPGLGASSAGLAMPTWLMRMMMPWRRSISVSKSRKAVSRRETAGFLPVQASLARNFAKAASSGSGVFFTAASIARSAAKKSSPLISWPTTAAKLLLVMSTACV